MRLPRKHCFNQGSGQANGLLFTDSESRKEECDEVATVVTGCVSLNAKLDLIVHRAAAHHVNYEQTRPLIASPQTRAKLRMKRR